MEALEAGLKGVGGMPPHRCVLKMFLLKACGPWPLPLILPADGRAALPASVESGRVFGWPRVPSLWERAGQPVGATEPQSRERAPGQLPTVWPRGPGKAGHTASSQSLGVWAAVVPSGWRG